MTFRTVLYPVYRNRLSSGEWQVGFLAGEINEENQFFENAGVVTRTFAKKPNFKFMQKVPCTVKIAENSEEKQSLFARLVGRKADSVNVVGTAYENITFDNEGDEVEE